MPYKSVAQRGWAHTPEGIKALGGTAKVAEWDAASKGRHLPQKVQSAFGGGVMSNKGYQSATQSFARGGAVLGRTTDFLKTPDRFAGRQFKAGGARNDEDWEKGSSKANPKGRDKSLKAVVPRD